MRRAFLLIAIAVGLGVGIGDALGEAPIVRDLPAGLHVPDAARPGPGFDVDRATEAWLALLSPEQRRLSDAYFEGGYWLHLWELLYGLVALTLLLGTGWSRRLRDLAERFSRRRFLSGMLYAAMFLVAYFVLRLPIAIYAGFWREHQYGLSNLSFPGWMREALIALAVEVVIGSLVLALLFAGIRRTGARWWAWAIAPTFVTILALEAIFPVFVAPLFNDYKPLPEGPTRDAVYALARANEIPTDHVAWFDASRQTTRISANVSGVFGVTRLSLNDNLLDKTSLPEIKAVLGHEMGHYVLDHVYVLAVYQTLLLAIALWAVSLALDGALARWGPRLGLRDRADPAALPLGLAIFSVVWFLLSPLENTIIRTVEAEADAFGLNAAREPEGFAMAAMRLSTYRKLKPGPAEEFLFYDHPSGYERVRRAMLWRKENLPAAATR
jgi:Zn-dependent protease with chaperone function